jgi:hypothetical protein
MTYPLSCPWRQNSRSKEHGSAAVRVHWDYPPFAFQKNGGSGVTGEFAGFVWS